MTAAHLNNAYPGNWTVFHPIKNQGLFQNFYTFVLVPAAHDDEMRTLLGEPLGVVQFNKNLAQVIFGVQGLGLRVQTMPPPL